MNALENDLDDITVNLWQDIDAALEKYGEALDQAVADMWQDVNKTLEKALNHTP